MKWGASPASASTLHRSTASTNLFNRTVGDTSLRRDLPSIAAGVISFSFVFNAHNNNSYGTGPVIRVTVGQLDGSAGTVNLYFQCPAAACSSYGRCRFQVTPAGSRPKGPGPVTPKNKLYEGFLE